MKNCRFRFGRIPLTCGTFHDTLAPVPRYWNTCSVLVTQKSNLLRRLPILSGAAADFQVSDGFPSDTVQRQLACKKKLQPDVGKEFFENLLVAAFLLNFFALLVRENRAERKGVTMFRSIHQKTIQTETGKTAGVIYGDVLRIVKARHHFVRRYQGFGADPEHLRTAQAQGARWVEFVDHNGQTYRVRIADFLAFGIPDDLGAGRQIFMSLKSMKWYMRRDATLDLEADILQDRRERQMQMFGGEGSKWQK